MRVLIVSSYYYPATCFGGPVWSTRAMVRGLADAGHEVEVITTAANEPRDDVPRVDQVDGVKVTYCKRLGSASWSFSPELAAMIGRRANCFDIIHSGVWTYPSAMASILARRRGIPYVLAPRGSFDPWAYEYKGPKKRLYMSLIEGRNLRHSAFVHCLTKREAAQVRALVPGARCEVIPNAATIDPGALTDEGCAAYASRFPRLEGKRVVLFLSRVHQKKGLDLLIPAFARVAARFPDAHLVIAGPDEGGYKATVDALIEQHALGGAVTFTGLLNGQDKLAAFERAEVFVLPSYSEGLPVVVLEALACGRPVVITDPCNLTDEVQGAGAGLVVDVTADAVAEGIETLLADPARARSMGEAGRKLATEGFSLEAVTGKLVDLFQDIIERRRNP